MESNGRGVVGEGGDSGDSVVKEVTGVGVEMVVDGYLVFKNERIGI